MALAALGFSLFSWADAILKWGTNTLSVVELVFWNDVFALLAVCLTAPLLGGFKQTLRSKYKVRHLARGVFFTVQFLVILKAFSLMPMANVYSIMFCAPLMTTLLAVFLLKEKTDLLHWLAILAGFAGVLIILRPGFSDFEAGFIYALCSMFLLSMGQLVNRTIPHSETKLSFGLYAILVTLVVSGFLVIWQGFRLPDLNMLLILTLSGTLSGVAVMLVGMGFSKAQTAYASAMQYIQMVWGSLLGFLVFGDLLDLWVGLGALIIVSSGLTLLFHSKTAG